VRYEELFFEKDRLHSFLREADRQFRRALKTGHYLREKKEDAWAAPYAAAALEQLRQEREPDALLSAAELLLEHPDAASCADTHTALRRFRADYLPSAKLDPDAPQPRITPRGLVRFLPLAAILVLALGMLASAGQKQARTQSNVTVITRRGT
jgi:hypothetical protein